MDNLIQMVALTQLGQGRYLSPAKTQAPTDPPRKMSTRHLCGRYPDNARLLLENESVLVVEVKLRPGEKLPEHEDLAHVTYDLTDYDIRITENQQSRICRHHAGETHWVPSCVHAVENVGPTTADFLLVERKPPFVLDRQD